MGRWHAYAARKVGARVHRLIDRDEGRARRLANDHPGARVATGIAAALDDPRVEVVHICTPIDSHAPLARAALAAGRHVLAEKPLTRTAGELAALYELANIRRVQLAPVHQFPFQRGVHQARTWLPRIAPVRIIAFTICSAGGDGHDAAGRDEIVAEILPHPLALLLAMFPDAALDLSAWQVTRSAAGELLITGLHAGATFTCTISLAARPTCFALGLRGEHGAVELDFFHGFATRLGGEVGRRHKILHPFANAGRTFLAAGSNLALRSIRRQPAYPGLEELIAAFYDAAVHGRPCPIAPDQALAVAQARDQLMAAQP